MDAGLELAVEFSEDNGIENGGKQQDTRMGMVVMMIMIK